MADRDAVYAWADRVVAEHGTVNLIINNAGVALGATVESMSYEDFEWLMNINFWGVVYGTKAFLPHLKQSGEGHIVNLSSVFGLISVPSQSAYNAAKFAVRGFTDSLRMELEIEGANVSVTTVHPGGIKTNIARNARMDASVRDVAGDPEKAVRDFERAFITSPEKAAEQILTAVRRDRRRALIGPDAKAIDLVSRLPADDLPIGPDAGCRLPAAYAVLTAPQATARAPNPLSAVPMASRQRRSIDSVEVPRRPAASANAMPWINATRTCATSVSSPRSRPASMHRRTRPTIRMRTELVAASSSGPGEKSVKGRENMTSARSRLARMNRRYAVARAHRSSDGIGGLCQRRQLTRELPETLEVELADDPRLVPEQLVERGGRGLAPGRPTTAPSAQPHPLRPEDRRRRQAARLAQLRGALLRPRHQEVPGGAGAFDADAADIETLFRNIDSI